MLDLINFKLKLTKEELEEYRQLEEQLANLEE